MCGRSSKVRITASAAATTVRVDGVEIAPSAPDVYEVTRTSSKIDIVCPEGCAVSVSTASGSITTRGRLGAVRTMTMSGNVSLEHAADIEARSGSGRLQVDSCDGCCRVVTASGRIDLDGSDDVEIATVSGAVHIGQLRGRAAIRTVTGAVSLGADSTAQVEVHSVSGKVAVELPAASLGTMTLRSVTGRVIGELLHGDGAGIEVSTISGSIEVRSG